MKRHEAPFFPFETVTERENWGFGRKVARAIFATPGALWGVFFGETSGRFVSFDVLIVTDDSYLL